MRTKWLGVLAVMSAVCSAQAALFTGAGSDQNFSTTGNWDAFPIEGDSIAISVNGTSSAAPAVVDSAFTAAVDLAKIYSEGTGGTGMAYAEVASGGTLKASAVLVGNAANQYYDGTLIVRTGGTVVNRYLNSGSLSIGGGDAGEVGIMTIESGASVTHTELNLQTQGSLTFEFGANSVSTFNSTRTTAGGANTLNGLLQVDLGALTEAGTYTLINSSDADLLIAGALKTSLDAASGTITGTGNYSSANFAVLNGGTTQWELTTADDGQDLTLTVIPEPATIGMLGLGAVMAVLLRRVRR
jgi:hypothetical protein